MKENRADEGSSPALAPSVCAGLLDLAEELETHPTALLQAWRVAVDADKRLSSSQQLSRAQFEDHLPELLRGICEWLRAPESPLLSSREAKTAQAHGLHRWQQGYTPFELTRDWGAFQECLLVEVERARLARGLTPEAAYEASRALTRFLNESLSQSVTAWQKIQESEAATHAADLEVRLSDLENAYEVLQAFDRARGDTLRAASHDLKGGLTVVQSAAELLHLVHEEPHREIGTAEHTQLLVVLRRSVGAMGKMLSDLLDLARLEAGQERVHVDAFDAAAMLRQLAVGLSPLAAEAGLKFSASGPETLPVDGDAVQTGRIAQNLLLNALRYTRAGEVELTWRLEPNDEWSFAVRDTGPGLAESSIAPLAGELREATRLDHEVAPHPADDVLPAPTGASAARIDGLDTPQNPSESGLPPGGEGIGLSIVKRLCELLDARLEVASQRGQGTVIRALLPRNLQPAEE